MDGQVVSDDAIVPAEGRQRIVPRSAFTVGDALVDERVAGRESHIRNGRIFLLIHSSEVMDLRDRKHGQFIVPALEDKVLAEGRRLTPVFRDIVATDGVTL